MNENEFIPTQKWCRLCDTLKPISQFNRNGSGGYRTECRACYNEHQNEQRAARKAGKRHKPPPRRPVPAWSVCGPYYPKDANGLLVPLSRLDKAQRAQVRQLNKLRAKAGVFLLLVEDD